MAALVFYLGILMSIKVMTRVWEHAPYKESTLLVLLALADYADDHGICYPDVPSLSAKARVSDRRAIDIIQSLEKDGAIAFHRGGGRGKRSCYAVLVGLTEEQKERVKLFHRNYFTENKTVKLGAKKGETSSKKRVNYSVNSDIDSAQQDAPNPNPIRHHDPSPDPSSIGGGDDEFLKTLIREFNISSKKAREIVATGVDPETCYQSIRNCVNPNDPHSMGRLILRLIDAPPQAGKPYDGPYGKPPAQNGTGPRRPKADTLSREALAALARGEPYDD